jgi:phage baseplate assembly protein W
MTFPLSLPFELGGTGGGLTEAEIAAQVGKFFGGDIWFDVSQPDQTGHANYVITPAGDVAMVSEHEALRQSLIRRYLTNPGDWKTAPNYGAGCRQYVKGKNTAAERAELESRVRAQSLRDPRVLTVDLATVTPLEDGSPGIRLSVKITPKGRLRGDQALPIHLEIR